MGIDKELIIKLKLDRSQAKQSDQQFAAEHKQVEKQVIDDVKAAELAKVELVKQANKERVKAALDGLNSEKIANKQVAKEQADARIAADKEAATHARQIARDTLAAQKQAFREATQAQKQATREADAYAKDAAHARVQASREASAQVGKSSAGMIGATTAIAQEALQQVKQFVAEVANAIKSAEQQAKAMTAEFGNQREQLAHLAGLEGKQADNAYTLEFARFNRRTGLTASESIASQEAYLNSGMQYRGKTISEGEHDQFKEQQARLAVARQIDPKVVADLAGRSLGMKDYKKFGNQASEQALGDVNTMLSVLSSGTGEDAQLVRETTKVMASQANEDALRGTLKSGTEAAKLVSVMTEGYPEGQAEAVNAMLRTQRGFKKAKGGKFLAAAGVTPEMDPFEANKRIGEHAEKLAKAGPAGTTIQDVLRENFEDELGARAIGVAYNKGTTGGLFEARDVTARENAGPESAMAQITAAEGTERVQRRMADADVRAAEMERGAENSGLEIRRKQALAKLIREKRISTAATNIGDYVKDKATFGMLGDPEQRRIDEEVAKSLGMKKKGWIAAGNEALGGQAMTFDANSMPPEARERILNQRLAELDNGKENRIPQAGQQAAPQAGPGGADAQVRAAEMQVEAAKLNLEAAKAKRPKAPAPLPAKGPAPQMRPGG